MSDTNIPGAVECMFCGNRQEYPQFTMRDLHRVAREEGFAGRLNDDRTALAAICPACGRGDCPDCGQPVSEHQTKHGKVTNCDGTPRMRSDG